MGETVQVPSAPLQVIVGLDFGTSSTKVAYQQLGVPTRQVRPILFGHGLEAFPDYCLPSTVAASPDGRLLTCSAACAVLARGGYGAGIRRLKVVVAGRSAPEFREESAELAFGSAVAELPPSSRAQPEQYLAVVMAAQMRVVRRWLERRLGTGNLALVFNVCVPIDHVEHNAVLRAFERVIWAAQALECGMEDEEVEDAGRLLHRSESLLRESKYDSNAPETRIYLVPEAIAQVATYLRSLEATEGIHAVIDFGAGTTDVSIFELTSPGRSERRCYWYDALNMPVGSAAVERIVGEYLRGQRGGVLPTDGEVAKRIEDLSRAPESLKEGLRVHVNGLWRESWSAWCRAYGRKRTQGAWERDRVRVFVCGGAARLPGVESVFAQSWMSQATGPNWGPYPIGPLPHPSNYVDPQGKAPFHRMSVAYGLAQPLPELGDFGPQGDHILPRDCPDNTPPRPFELGSLPEVASDDDWDGSGDPHPKGWWT